MNAKKKFLRVAAQLTISPRIISLVAEEDLMPYRKGMVIKRINCSTFDKMERPLSVQITAGGGILPMLKKGN